MHNFYLPDISADQIEIGEEEARHITKSLRLKINDQFWILNGQGEKALCKILALTKRKVSALITKRFSSPKTRSNLHLAIAPTKNMSRLEWFVEKATELGIGELTFLNTDRTERQKIKIDRIKKISISALKQSGNLFLPKINSVVKFNDFISADHPEELRFIPNCATHGLPHLSTLIKPEKDTLVLIGPAGDFTLAEIKTSLQNGFMETSLGGQRLRSETAAIMVVSVFSFLNQV